MRPADSGTKGRRPGRRRRAGALIGEHPDDGEGVSITRTTRPIGSSPSTTRCDGPTDDCDLGGGRLPRPMRTCGRKPGPFADREMVGGGAVDRCHQLCRPPPPAPSRNAGRGASDVDSVVDRGRVGGGERMPAPLVYALRAQLRGRTSSTFAPKCLICCATRACAPSPMAAMLTHTAGPDDDAQEGQQRPDPVAGERAAAAEMT